MREGRVSSDPPLQLDLLPLPWSKKNTTSNPYMRFSSQRTMSGRRSFEELLLLFHMKVALELFTSTKSKHKTEAKKLRFFIVKGNKEQGKGHLGSLSPPLSQFKTVLEITVSKEQFPSAMVCHQSEQHLSLLLSTNVSEYVTETYLMFIVSGRGPCLKLFGLCP
ncbi:hypothetical protein NC653_008869 [Populus alba x Populus x berolinensis]|uniref:Uncharacterized protein n=1 Tax=Populus alba x Populus x berolinensis TaxID=444605 RepID=A0AAD6R7H6_9ROSI|nr:hypothetical protein NC653_008869 [Populus alba x Populus x berolinensis]